MATINRETFDKLKERMGAKFPVLLEGYLKDAKAYIVTIETNMTPEGDIAPIIDAAHSLKSASGLLGITDVHAEAEKVEYTGKGEVESGSNNVAMLRNHIDDLRMAFSAVEADLQAELAKAKAAHS